MDELTQDIRQALRLLRHRPGFALLVVLCLALGIGANTAIFSVVNGVLLRPLPYKDPDRLVLLFDVSTGPDGKPEQYNASAPNFLAWKEQAHSLERLEAMQTDFFNLADAEPVRLDGAEVSAGFFDLLGAQPTLGRTFTPEEDRPGGPLAAVVSHDLWRRRFAGDPKILGRSLVLNGHSYSVVGVMAPGFYFQRPVDVWVPLALAPSPQLNATAHYLFSQARLRPGVTLAKAQAEMNAIAGRLAQEHPDTNGGWSVDVVALQENLVAGLRRGLWSLLSAVVFVLLIACTNVTNLLLTRAAERRGELAVRSALGADRGRLVRQVLTESSVLALLGGALGLVLAFAALRFFASVGPASLTALSAARIDLRVLLFTLAISLLAGLLPGIVPAFGALRSGLSRLKGEAARSTEGVEGRRLQGLLVVAEVALALVLLVCAGLMIKSFERLRHLSPGFEPAGVLVTEIALPEWKYKDPDQLRGFWRELLPRVETIPGVLSAGITHAMPVNDFALTTVFRVENRLPESENETLVANFRKVSPHFFDTLRIPLVAGRGFTEADDAQHPPVAIVSQQMARRYWPGGQALGRGILRGGKTVIRVVGIAADVQDGPYGTDPGNTIYIPLVQNPRSANPMVYLMTRGRVEPRSLSEPIRRAVLAVDKDQPVGKVQTMEDWISTSLSMRRFDTWMLTLFAFLGMVLAIVGIYGVLSYAVRRRNHEIGIRMSLGARRADIVRLVLRQGFALAATGLVIGLVLSIAATQLISGLLFQVKPTDPATFSWIVLGLLAVALLASYVPARRAARVDPITSLKGE